MDRRISLTGPELKAARRKAGISQTAMAELIGCSRHSVSYWETKPQEMDHNALKWGVPALMLEVLGIEVLPIYRQSKRARGGGVLDDLLEREVERLLARQLERDLQRLSRLRIPCGAMTRKGKPCRLKSEPGKRRCKFHGGKSTGPKTPEGKARIAEAQRRRWAVWRARNEKI